MESEIKFPLSHPTHYLACLNDTLPPLKGMGLWR